MTSLARTWSVLTSLVLVSAFACGGGTAADDDDDADAGAGTGGSTGGNPGKGGTTSAGKANAGQAGTAGKSSTGGNGGSSSAGKSGASGAGGVNGGGDGGAGRAGSGNVGGGGMTGEGGDGNASGTSGSGGNAGSGGDSAGSAGTGRCSDSCPLEGGVSYECKKRFMYGVNYAWQNFAADFGGGNRGIAANLSTVRSELQQMSENGVSVVRWWVWPNFTGNGVSFDGSGAPSGLTSTTVEDLEAALDLAAENDLYLMLTLFSFDNFKSNLPADRNLATIGTNATQRAALVSNVVRPFARAASMNENADRLIAWDVINEPEWAVTGASLYGDEAFDPDDTCDAISHAEMETLLRDVITGLRAESSALVTIGAAAMKWKHAWTELDQDFYQFHIYDWVNDYWPYTMSPVDFDMGDKPMVMGEFPPTGLGGDDYRTVIDSWFANGYAGALAWRDATFHVDYAEVKSFADAHACETAY